MFLLQILEHSPWLQTRPLFLLALHQPDASSPLTYTLRTRVQRKGAEDELSKVCVLIAGSSLCWLWLASHSAHLTNCLNIHNGPRYGL